MTTDNEPQDITVDKCWDMVRRRKISIPGGLVKDIELDRENQFNFFEVGAVYSEWSSFLYPWTREAKCRGGEITWGRNHEHMIHDGVVSILMKVIITRESFAGDDHSTNAEFSHVSLPCDLKSVGCSTIEGTFIWDEVHEQCPGFRVSRSPLVGYSVVEEDGSEYFISSDKSLVRIERLTMSSHCGRIFYSTPYPDIFIHELGSVVEPLTSFVDQRDVNVFSYVRNRDEFLYHDLRGQLEAELSYVRQKTCLARLEEQRRNFFLKLEIPGLTSVSLGNGTFGTSGGEVLHTYSCDEVTVYARDDDRCYDVLPVENIAHRSDGLSYTLGRFDRMNSSVKTSWFLEPVTHRLTNVAVEQLCSKIFPNKYQNRRGIWMKAVPGLELADAPLSSGVLQTLASLMSSRNTGNDYSQGGIYSTELLKGYNQRLEQKRVVTAVVAKMASEASDEIIYGTGVQFGPDHLFPDLALPWYSGMWEYLISWYETWGVFCAAMLGIYTSFCILRALFGLFMRLLFLKDLKEPLSQVLYRLVCLQCFLERKYEELHHRQQDMEMKLVCNCPSCIDGVSVPQLRDDKIDGEAKLDQMVIESEIRKSKVKDQHRQGQSPTAPGDVDVVAMVNAGVYSSSSERYVPPSERTIPLLQNINFGHYTD